MKGQLQAFLFMIIFKTGFSQNEYVYNLMSLPDNARNKTIEIKVEKYRNDTLLEKYSFLNAKFTKNNMLKILKIENRMISEFYSVESPSVKKYIYRKNKNIIKVRRKNEKLKYIDYFENKLKKKHVFISNSGLRWSKSFHRKPKLEWDRHQHTEYYSYDDNGCLIRRFDKDEYTYNMKYDSLKNCIEKKYYYKDSLLWIRSYEYDNYGNMIMEICSDINGRKLFKVINTYNSKNQITSQSSLENDEIINYHTKFIYDEEIIQRREDYNEKNDTKTIYYYSYN